MANKLFQNIIHQLKEASDRKIGVLDEAGTIIACSDIAAIGEKRENAFKETVSTANIVNLDGFSYKQMSYNSKLNHIVFVEGIDEIAKNTCQILAVSLSSVKYYHDEKFDKTNFVRNVILDNVLPEDLYVKAKEINFLDDVYRVAILIHLSESNDYSALDIVSSLFSDKNRDFVISVNEYDIVIIKEVKAGTDAKELETFAKQIFDVILEKLEIEASIGIGTVVSSVRDIARSFKECQIAIGVGKVFDAEKNIVHYDSLGIGRLIYQLPTTLCEIFLHEVFKKGSASLLDSETLFTIQKFFENNLNVSETSRKLFVHRNTLVYRLEKIKKITGLDLREFDHAIVFKVALMVQKYLNSNTSRF